MSAIIREGAKLNAAINKMAATGKEYRAIQHQVAVSTIFHAAEHGDARPMTAFFGYLSRGDQQLFRMYLRRVTHEVGGRWIDYSTSDGFLVVKTTDKADGANVAKRRRDVVNLSERLIACKEGDKWLPDVSGKATPIVPFHDPNPFRENMAVINDADALKAIRRFYKLAMGENVPANTRVQFSEAMKKELASAEERFERIAEATNAAEELSTLNVDGKPESKAARRRKAAQPEAKPEVPAAQPA